MNPFRLPRARWRAGTAAAVVAAVVVAGIGYAVASSRSVRLQLPGDPYPAGQRPAAPRLGAAITVGVGTVLCLNRPGVATVTAVRGEASTDNVEVQGFAVRPNPSLRGADQLGDVRGTLTDAGFRPGRHRVDVVCDAHKGAGYELAVQLARVGAGPGVSQAFLVDWKSSTGRGTVRVPLTVVLCDARTAFPARCSLDARGAVRAPG